jgi:hypothetical protein
LSSRAGGMGRGAIRMTATGGGANHFPDWK